MALKSKLVSKQVQSGPKSKSLPNYQNSY